MATNVTNQQILDALNAMGYSVTGAFDTRGKQNSEFRNRVISYLQPNAKPGEYAEDYFNKAKDVARQLADIKPTDPPWRRLQVTLNALGVDPHQTNQIIAKAGDMAKQVGRDPQNFNDQDFFDAASVVMGNGNDVLRRAGITAGVSNQIRDVGTAPFGSQTDQRQAGPAVPQPGAPIPPTGSTTPPTSNAPTSTSTTPTGTSKAPGAGGPGSKTPRPAGGPGAVDQGLPKGAPDAQVIAYFQKNYGADAWMMQIPGFVDIARKIAEGGGAQWSEQAIVSAVQGTDWWKQNGSSVFDYMEQKANDPIGFQRSIGGATKIVRDEAQKFGIQLDDATAANLADSYVKFGWQQDPTLLSSALAGQWHYQNNVHTQVGDTLNKTAGEWLQPVGSDVVQQWGHDIIAGTKTYDDFTETMKNQAASMFPGLTDQINKGFTLQQISDPYRQQAAKLLEIDPSSVNFMDPKYMRALDTVDPKTGQHASMSQSDWTHTLMMDPQYRYDFTDQARQAATSMGESLLKTFGAVA